jgi:hypothetical protein
MLIAILFAFVPFLSLGYELIECLKLFRAEYCPNLVLRSFNYLIDLGSVLFAHIAYLGMCFPDNGPKLFKLGRIQTEFAIEPRDDKLSRCARLAVHDAFDLLLVCSMHQKRSRNAPEQEN